MLSHIFISTILFFLCIYISNGEKCHKDDFIFRYTECDKSNHRWLVTVPKGNKTCDTSSEFDMPKKARDCGNPCEQGRYLDINTQECTDCPMGTFSQGDIIEIENWDHLPIGFRTYSNSMSDTKCDSEEWKPTGDSISSEINNCESSLIFTVSLHKRGVLRFYYQLVEDETLFQVKVSNDECLVDRAEDKHYTKTLDMTGPNRWDRIDIQLSKGKNVILWNVLGGINHRATVKINYVKVTNTIFTSECTDCPAGFFSSARSSKCTPCEMNKYSTKPKSSQCENCSPTKYAFPGSSSCIDRPKCAVSDYSFKWTNCTEKNQRKKIYYWIEPKICSEDIPNSVHLPIEDVLIPCPSCPDGTILNSTTSNCVFCPSDKPVSNSEKGCHKCDPNQMPVYQLIYNKWARPVPNLTFRCLKTDESTCNTDETWIYNGDHLRSSSSFDINILQLDFDTNIGGSSKSADSDESSSLLTFDFSMNCTVRCVLHLFLGYKNFQTIRVFSWVNSTDRQTYKFNLRRKSEGHLVWLFSRNREIDIRKKNADYVNLYSITLGQLKNVGASRCQICDTKSNDCFNCGKGKYFSNKSNKCENCPMGTILKHYPGLSQKDCRKCSEGLTSMNGTACVPDVHFKSPGGHQYILSPLQRYFLLRGSQLFTAHGQEYSHIYNVTLFPRHNEIYSRCLNNITGKEEISLGEMGPVCRLTTFSSRIKNGTVYAVQSISLAETFVSLKQSNQSLDVWKEMNNSLTKNGFSGDVNGLDLHIKMTSERKTEVCLKGRETLVTLRCDSTKSEDKFILSPKCPVETCDGCNFHFLLTSKSACPICREEDYTVIPTECVNGHQKVYYQSPGYCIRAPNFQTTIIRKCPLISFKLEVAAIVTAVVVLLLVCIVIYCYKKNKKLEYKYMRLVGANDDNDNVMTGAESCAMHDDEDEDDIKIRASSKSGKIFAKFNKTNRYRDDERGSSEVLNLNEKAEFDI